MFTPTTISLSQISGFNGNVSTSVPQLTRVVVPPDGGWGWIVVGASFILNFCIDGIVYCFGIFLSDISTDLKAHPTKIALANSLMTGFYFFCGPITCGLTNSIGFRCVAATGCVILGGALLIASYVYNVIVFLIVTGFASGVGLNMIYTPSLLIVGFYFEKWRALSTAISLTGTSFGIMAFPPIIQALLNRFQWRVTFRIISAICFCLIFLTLTFRPIKPIKILEQQRGMGAKIILETLNAEDSIGTYSSEKIKFLPRMKNFICERLKRKPKNKEGVEETTTQVIYHETNSEVVSFVPHEFAVLQRPSIAVISQFKDVLTLIDSEDIQNRIQWWKQCCLCCKNENNRPMHREDILYHGSLSRTLSKKYSRSFVSGVRLSSSDNLTTRSKHYNIIHRVLATMLDFKLLKSLAFIFLIASGFFTMLGFYAIFMFMIERTEEIGLSQSDGALLLTIIGLASTAGRIMCGVLSCIPRIDLLIFSHISLFIAAIATMASAYLKHWISQVICMVLFGFNTASFHVLRTVVLADLFGIEKLTNAFGINILVYGTACFAGIPLAGAIYNASGSYASSFLCAGAFILISAIFLVPIKYIKKWEDQRQPLSDISL